VTIRTKEAEYPSQFPPARLFLDDIDEIVRILLEATANWRDARNPSDKDTETKVTFTIKDQVCDEVQELSKIAKKTNDLEIEVRRKRWAETALNFTRYRTSLNFFLVPTEERLNLYYKLAPVFKRRNLWLATLVHSHRVLFRVLLVLLLFANSAPFIPTLKKHTPPTLSMAIAIFSVPLVFTHLATAFHHSTIILRHSSEPSSVRQGLLDKLPAALIGGAVGAVLTFLLTMLGLYLKHKYWP